MQDCQPRNIKSNAFGIFSSLQQLFFKLGFLDEMKPLLEIKISPPIYSSIIFSGKHSWKFMFVKLLLGNWTTPFYRKTHVWCNQRIFFLLGQITVSLLYLNLAFIIGNVGGRTHPPAFNWDFETGNDIYIKIYGLPTSLFSVWLCVCMACRLLAFVA